MAAEQLGDYEAFLRAKRTVARPAGFEVDPSALHPALFAFQRDLVRWALRRGRAALFTATGTGKTLMQCGWASRVAERTRRPALILAPLAVARQTVDEAARWGIGVGLIRRQAEAAPSGVSICNYEMLHALDPAAWGAVVLDESSCLKDYTTATRQQLVAAFRDTPYRLCATATPAPNDIQEIANHAEFLGVMSRAEMLAAFFVHDDAGWRLKGHARLPFYRWLASWAMALTTPSDIGYPDDGYRLPPLDVRPVLVPTDWRPPGQLFAGALKGVGERAAVRKATQAERVRRALELIAAEPGERWIAWCGLNEEGRALARALPDAVLVEGADPPEAKAEALLRFARGGPGAPRVLITKASIAGWGLNLQSCARMVFVGLSDSWESWYQAIRRCWRFGQSRPVHVYAVLADAEEAIWHNVMRKEREATEMTTELVRHAAGFEREELHGTTGHQPYDTGEDGGEGWRLLLGDSAERLRELERGSVGLAVFSPPFEHLYVYSPSERDLGNSAQGHQFWQHFAYISRELLRVVLPGRNVCVHVAQLPLTKAIDGVIGMRDFRGDTIRHFTAAGFVYHGEICIDKDPQAQAIRTHSKSLLFVQLRKDSSWMRPALADYILIFRAPGDNPEPVRPDLTNEEWIEWARPIWYGIDEGNTLNVAEARDDDDGRHICPLQLGVIERCIRLWSNRGDLVLSPFAGIGSEGHEAIRLGRRFVGVELKRSYWETAVRNLKAVEARARRPSLLDVAGMGG